MEKKIVVSFTAHDPPDLLLDVPNTFNKIILTSIFHWIADGL